MLRHRVILAAICAVLVVGSVTSTLAYAMHLRSDGYRRATQARLSQRLNMPVEISRITPLSFASSRFENIRTWLPQHRLQVFGCQNAIWRAIKRDGRVQHELELEEGWVLVGTGGWTRADYEAILQSGLGHDFAAIGLSKVHLDRIDFRWDHPDFQLSAKDSTGIILFDDNGVGQAALDSRRFNDHPTKEPIHIHATFRPGQGLRFDEVVLAVPRMPLGTLRLDNVLGGGLTAGTFAGRVVYRQSDREHLILSGNIVDGSLAELTRQVIGGPFTGGVTVTLDEAEFVDTRLKTLRLHGWLDEVRVGDLFPVLAVPGEEGRLNLEIGQFDFEDGKIARLSASGQADNLPLEVITQRLGYGKVTGRLRVRINSLLILDEQLRAADVDLIATPPADAPGIIDKETVRQLLLQLVGIDTSRVLPAEVEYVKLGAKLLFSGEELTLRGTHGPTGRTILTIRVAGREFGVITQPDRTFAVGDLIARLRQEVDRYDFQQIEDWWSQQHEEN
jgi:hypothetical protein